jgi:hypothetical protein
MQMENENSGELSQVSDLADLKRKDSVHNGVRVSRAEE